MAFRFLQFTVNDEKSTMRVGTDSMLLGSWANPEKAARILDIGTGCGILALMMAQKSSARIDAVEVDEESAREAHLNFSNSPWKERLSIFNESIGDFQRRETGPYDFIISNPPYFSRSLQSPSHRKNLARHDHGMSLGNFVAIAGSLLSVNGTLALVIPATLERVLKSLCLEHGLIAKRWMWIRPNPSTPAKLILMEFSATASNQGPEPDLILRDDSGVYSADYLKLTSAFHQFQ